VTVVGDGAGHSRGWPAVAPEGEVVRCAPVLVMELAERASRWGMGRFGAKRPIPVSAASP
jgi:hypothetical protein